MTDLRTRALAALSGACWPDNEAREETIKRVVAFVEAEIAAENEAIETMTADLYATQHRLLGITQEYHDDLASNWEGGKCNGIGVVLTAIRARRENANEKC